MIQSSTQPFFHARIIAIHLDRVSEDQRYPHHLAFIWLQIVLLGFRLCSIIVAVGGIFSEVYTLAPLRRQIAAF